MEINDKALDAAVRALFEDGCGEPKVDAATMLEAAAPFIAAQALRDAAETLFHVPDDNSEEWHEGYVCALERLLGLTSNANRADELDPQ